MLGLSLSALAGRAGVRAPSHIHHIEKGEKVPSEKIAAGIARALGDDEELYRAWARVRQRGDYLVAREAVQVIVQRLEWEAPAAGSVPAPAALIRVPLLDEGSDTDAREPQKVIRLDPATLPPDLALFRPFAWFVSADGARRVMPRLEPRDLVVVTRNAWPIQSDEIYAVRTANRVMLSWVRWLNGTLWLLPAQGDAGGEALPPTGSPPMALAGRVAIVVRYRGR